MTMASPRRERKVRIAKVGVHVLGEGERLRRQGTRLHSWSRIIEPLGRPGGSVIKNLPSNAGYSSSIPGWGT